MVAAVKGEPKQAIDMKVAVESGMEVLIREEGEAAAGRVESAWQAHPAGRQLLANTKDDLSRASRDYPLAAANAVRAWQGDVLELVSREGAAKKSAARFWALGVNGVGVALMVLVFSQTGGLIGAEVGVAGGPAVLAPRVLEAIFGEDAVRRLAKQAATDPGGIARPRTRPVPPVDAIDVRPEQAGEIAAAHRNPRRHGRRTRFRCAGTPSRPEPRPAVPAGDQ